MTSDPTDHRCPACGSTDPHNRDECRTLGDTLRESVGITARHVVRRVYAAAKWLGLVQ